jgi:hypothetical protein
MFSSLDIAVFMCIGLFYVYVVVTMEYLFGTSFLHTVDGSTFQVLIFQLFLFQTVRKWILHHSKMFGMHH